jgi:hypothetical protein
MKTDRYATYFACILKSTMLTAIFGLSQTIVSRPESWFDENA